MENLKSYWLIIFINFKNCVVNIERIIHRFFRKPHYKYIVLFKIFNFHKNSLAEIFGEPNFKKKTNPPLADRKPISEEFLPEEPTPSADRQGQETRSCH